MIMNAELAPSPTKGSDVPVGGRVGVGVGSDVVGDGLIWVIRRGVGVGELDTGCVGDGVLV